MMYCLCTTRYSTCSQPSFDPGKCELPGLRFNANCFTNSGAKQRHAFLDHMIQAVKKGVSLTDQELQAEVATLMLAVS